MGEFGEARVRACLAAELRERGVAYGEVGTAVVDGGAFLFGRRLGERCASKRHIAQEPAVARVQADESERARPVEAHAELPGKAELFDGVVVGGHELRPRPLVIGARERELRFEYTPKIVDVVLAAAMVANEGVEGGVEVAEQRCAGERGGRLCVHAEGSSPEGRGDLDAVGE